MDNLVEDIYKVVETQNYDPRYWGDFERSLMQSLTQENKKPSLRLSNAGLPPRQLWYTLHNDIPFKVNFRFIYGHILEAFIIYLIKCAGYKVTDEQKEVELCGIKGHIDLRINGILFDIKSASNYSFNKFKSGLIFVDDPFGYVQQIRSYAKACGDKVAYFLVINKETGEICIVEVDTENFNDSESVIKNAKSLVKAEKPPKQKCYSEQDYGKSGNKALHRLCTFCNFKNSCWQEANENTGLRIFEYSNGPVYLTKVVKNPKVEERV